MKVEKYQKQILLCKALEKLDEELVKANVEPFELNVCGGFALLLQQVRKNGSVYTDIDYIGKDLPEDIKDIIKKVGTDMNFGPDWINNDVLLSGSSLEEMEYATGKLHFEPKMQLSVIKINALKKVDILRMKMIAVDTSLCGTSFGGEFTRAKDFEDIKLLAEDLNMNANDIKKECKEYITCPEIFALVKYYLKTQDKNIFTKDNLLEFAKQLESKEQKNKRPNKKSSSYDEIDEILAMERETGGYSNNYSLDDFYSLF